MKVLKTKESLTKLIESKSKKDDRSFERDRRSQARVVNS